MKKRNIWLILLIFVLVLAAAGYGAWYVYQRQLPQKTVEEFLGSMQKTDFQSMEKLLQSSDLSALEDADIRDDAYLDFFKSLNKKMTWSIADSRFDYQNGTAQITAHVRYIDGSDIYRETISEFLRRMVSDALSGNTPGEMQTKAVLAEILTEKAASTEDRFTETDIIYPLIKTGSDWKIVSLDEETVKIMSANFKNVENEIHQSLQPAENTEEASETGEASETAEISETAGNSDAAGTENKAGAEDTADNASGETPENASGQTAKGNDDALELITDTFTIRYTSHQVSEDFSANPCLLVYYDYTNSADTPSSAMVDVRLQVFQNGKPCSAAIPSRSSSAIDRFMEEVQPGETVTVCQAFSLSGTEPVTLRASEAFSLTGELKSRTLNLN